MAEGGNVPINVEGFAVEVSTEADQEDIKKRLARIVPGSFWEAVPHVGGWLHGNPEHPLPTGQAAEYLRAILRTSGVTSAELLLQMEQPIRTGAEAVQQFALWGRIAEDRLAQIVSQSKEERPWSLVQMRVCDSHGQGGAWAIWKEKHPGDTPGEGIVVAHPDTGYTDHPRLLPRLQNTGINFVERDAAKQPTPDAKDPLTAVGLLEFPGHGTGTASVIVGSEGEGGEFGVAPGATLIPLRVSSSVVHFSYDNLRAALSEAIEQNAHIISMSLGGPLNSALLRAQIRAALDAGIIIVSAAGNYAPTIVFPACLPGVIACSASNVLVAPWRFSGMGDAVAITAPGELVWHARATHDPGGALSFDEDTGSGTSFATANIAGLAALWLSYHGRGSLMQRYPGSLLSYAFRSCLQVSARAMASGVRGFGKGIAQADGLLKTPLPDQAAVANLRDDDLSRDTGGAISFPVATWWSIATLPTLTAPAPLPPGSDQIAMQASALDEFLRSLLGRAPDAVDRIELATLAATNPDLGNALAKVAQQQRLAASPESIRRYLLSGKLPLSPTLKEDLDKQRLIQQAAYLAQHPEVPGELSLYEPPKPAPRWARRAEGQAPRIVSHFAIEPPKIRRLRAYAFDPSLATRTDSVVVNEITIPIVFEQNLLPGPIGDYLEVIDVDPASDCVYAPVDLNHPYILAQDGLPRSESNPMFHQQMAYAVGMKTIAHFEQALGRPLFWSPLRPWRKKEESDDFLRAGRPHRKSDQFVQRLRLYPHALREQNAYYSPEKRAILFGYFPADNTDPGVAYPGGIVFTCLAHDIVAHEMTHAILDGMHVYFTEPTNPDVFAFHEAFADIVALFQRFSYPSLLQDQIARSRGKLDSGTLLSQLALQFGQATGRHSALRDALGYVVTVGGQSGDSAAFDEDGMVRWRRFRASPAALDGVEEPHARGAFLVAAVFDAYLTIYDNRIADLKRIATGGTGILPDGDLHPDLVNRMADEAARSARHVLRMCIRAMDYTPPVDITFGEFLRALITADYDLVPEDPLRYRVAFIEAFRKWGIYPKSVRTLSEETLRWSPPSGERTSLFSYSGRETDEEERRALLLTRRALLKWRPGTSRQEVFDHLLLAQGRLHEYLKGEGSKGESGIQKLLEGIDLTADFQVTNMRPARRIGPSGEFLTELVVEIVQSQAQAPGIPLPFRGGITLIVSMDDDSFEVRYAIRKRAHSTEREATQRAYLLTVAGGADAAEYSSENLPAGWQNIRTMDREGMRASSCNCRQNQIDSKVAPKEPFALLHRG